MEGIAQHPDFIHVTCTWVWSAVIVFMMAAAGPWLHEIPQPSCHAEHGHDRLSSSAAQCCAADGVPANAGCIDEVSPFEEALQRCTKERNKLAEDSSKAAVLSLSREIELKGLRDSVHEHRQCNCTLAASIVFAGGVVTTLLVSLSCRRCSSDSTLGAQQLANDERIVEASFLGPVEAQSDAAGSVEAGASRTSRLDERVERSTAQHLFELNGRSSIAVSTCVQDGDYSSIGQGALERPIRELMPQGTRGNDAAATRIEQYSVCAHPLSKSCETTQQNELLFSFVKQLVARRARDFEIHFCHIAEDYLAFSALKLCPTQPEEPSDCKASTEGATEALHTMAASVHALEAQLKAAYEAKEAAEHEVSLLRDQLQEREALSDRSTTSDVDSPRTSPLSSDWGRTADAQQVRAQLLEENRRRHELQLELDTIRLKMTQRERERTGSLRSSPCVLQKILQHCESVLMDTSLSQHYGTAGWPERQTRSSAPRSRVLI
jgi:hypothetical protein